MPDWHLQIKHKLNQSSEDDGMSVCYDFKLIAFK